MSIIIRPALHSDKASIAFVESKATPNLSYVSQVFDMFLNDASGEFSVAEIDGPKIDKAVVACGKFTTLPDGSAWLETIRVRPDFQGRGIGKRFYERFFEIAAEKNISTLRMYTGVNNAVSKGLAEHFGFQLAETFHGMWKACPAHGQGRSQGAFHPVADPLLAEQALSAQSPAWHNYLVMNRTFYKLSPALSTQLVETGQVYQDAQSGSTIAIGARFMPEAALHIGQFSGDATACLDFAMQRGSQAQRVSCLFPAAATDIQTELLDYGFQLEPSAFIVMERQLG